MNITAVYMVLKKTVKKTFFQIQFFHIEYLKQHQIFQHILKRTFYNHIFTYLVSLTDKLVKKLFCGSQTIFIYKMVLLLNTIFNHSLKITGLCFNINIFLHHSGSSLDNVFRLLPVLTFLHSLKKTIFFYKFKSVTLALKRYSKNKPKKKSLLQIQLKNCIFFLEM